MSGWARGCRCGGSVPHSPLEVSSSTRAGSILPEVPFAALSELCEATRDENARATEPTSKTRQDRRPRLLKAMLTAILSVEASHSGLERSDMALRKTPEAWLAQAHSIPSTRN